MIVDAVQCANKIWEGKVGMLISMDLLNHMQKAIYDGGSPAQLCIIRCIGSDNDFIFRVRHEDVHLDYPVRVPLFDTADKVSALVNFDEITKALVCMSQLVVKPGAVVKRWRQATPQILQPVAYDAL